MKTINKPTALFSLIALILFTATAFKQKPVSGQRSLPLSLYDSIVAMDAMWEDAYNNCKLDVMEKIISEDLEFYHDQGGLMTSKQKLNEALKNNICGKVRRVLKKGSIEVHSIPGFGAVEMGMHGFQPTTATGTPDHYAKFVHIWKRENHKWRISRVISLH
jgi:hypothetical protein